MLQENNYNIATALARAKSETNVKVKFRFIVTGKEYEEKFSPQDEGMAMITFLNNKESSGNMYYKLYKDAGC